MNECNDSSQIGSVVHGSNDESAQIGNVVHEPNDSSQIGNVMNGSNDESPWIGNVVHEPNDSSQIGNVMNGSHEETQWIGNVINGSNDSSQIGNVVNGSNSESTWIGNMVNGSNDSAQLGNVVNGSNNESAWIGNAVHGSHEETPSIGNVVNGSNNESAQIEKVANGPHEETPWIGNVMNECNDSSQIGSVVHGSNDRSNIRNVVHESNDSSQIGNMVNGTRVETLSIANDVNGDVSGILSTGHLNVSNNTDPGGITRDGSVYGNELNGTDEPLLWFGNESQGSNNEIPGNASKQSTTDGDDSWNTNQLNATDGNMESLVNGEEIARNGSELNGTGEAVALIGTRSQSTLVGSDGNVTTIDRSVVANKPSGTGQNQVMNEVYPNRSNESLSQYKNELEGTNDKIAQTGKVINSGEISGNVSVQNLTTGETSWIWNELDGTSEETASNVMKQNRSCGDMFCNKDQMNGTSEEMPRNGSESNGPFVRSPLNEINEDINWNEKKHNGKISRNLSDQYASDWVIYTTENELGEMNGNSSLIENQSVGVSGELSRDDNELNVPSEEGNRTERNQTCAEISGTGNNDTRMGKKATNYALSRKASKQKVNSGKSSAIKNSPSKANGGVSKAGSKTIGAKHAQSVSQQKMNGKGDEKPNSGKMQSETQGEIPWNKMELNGTQEEMEEIGNKQNITNDTASSIENEVNITDKNTSKNGNNQNDSLSVNELNRMGGELKGVGDKIYINTSKPNITHGDAFWNGNQLNGTTEGTATGGSKVNGASGEVAKNGNELTPTSGDKSSTVANSDISRNVSNVKAVIREASSFRNNHVSIRQITWNGTEPSGTEEETSRNEHERDRKGEASSIRFMKNEDISIRSWNESKLSGTSDDVSLIERQMNGAAYIMPRTEKRSKITSYKITRNTSKQKAAIGEVSRTGKESKTNDKIFMSYETNGLLSKNMNEVAGSVSKTGIKVNETGQETARNAFKRNITRGNISGIGNDLNASTENVSTKKSVQYMNYGEASKNEKELKGTDGTKSWIGNDLLGDNEGPSRFGPKLSGTQGGISWSRSEKVQPEESSRSGENETGINGEESRNETEWTVTTEEISRNGTEPTTASAWNSHLVPILLVSFLGTLFFLLAILLVVLLYVKGLACFSREATHHSAADLMQQDPR
ncbi:probable cyclin-dependent serine/threonine-protein kinase DDB_G0292550 [Leucoraja erinacea]|uniref:probable cyclin-dependent serine/threonine-protein kinase DDB_G0292550 n=1 Tax=Leucoraja erinaceus TaxID=7782 RepID=UPI002456DD7F|nr:probable cyclin-dependent serine/threonine-protein kinase DDB_G0292550 [Leucoraja erinacea]